MPVPSTYYKPKRDFWLSSEGIRVISQLARNGYSQREIAKFIGIQPGTLTKWIKKFPDLKTAFSYSKEIANLVVEDALFRSAIGGEYKEEVLSKSGVPTVITRVAQPNPKSLTLWVTNRNPDKWSAHTEPPVVIDSKIVTANDAILQALKERPVMKNIKPDHEDQ